MILENKIALITGAASGVGRATAQLFAREGATLICTDIDDVRGLETVGLIRGEGLEAAYYHADASNSQELAAVADRCAGDFGQLDILFNNAGRTVKQTFEATTEQTWKEMLDLHLTGVFLCSRHFLPMMKKAGSGSIINHASVDSLFGNPSIAAYSAAKGGLIPLTHVMAHDLAKYQIRVNSISSGGIFTAMSLGKERVTASRIAVTPSKRMGTPQEVASVALFFASSASSFVNGANLVVDGGRTAITQGCFDA